MKFLLFPELEPWTWFRSQFCQSHPMCRAQSYILTIDTTQCGYTESQACIVKTPTTNFTLFWVIGIRMCKLLNKSSFYHPLLLGALPHLSKVTLTLLSGMPTKMGLFQTMANLYFVKLTKIGKHGSGRRSKGRKCQILSSQKSQFPAPLILHNANFQIDGKPTFADFHYTCVRPHSALQHHILCPSSLST